MASGRRSPPPEASDGAELKNSDIGVAIVSFAHSKGRAQETSIVFIEE